MALKTLQHLLKRRQEEPAVLRILLLMGLDWDLVHILFYSLTQGWDSPRTWLQMLAIQSRSKAELGQNVLFGLLREYGKVQIEVQSVNFPNRKTDTASVISRRREKAGENLFPSSISAAWCEQQHFATQHQKICLGCHVHYIAERRITRYWCPTMGALTF